MKSSFKATIGLGFAALLLAGCAEKLTYERWQTIADGMGPEAVEQTLGEPWHKADNTWVYWNDEKGITAKIYFAGDKVSGKTWADDRGIVGSSPNVSDPGDAEDLKIQKFDVEKK